MTAPFASPRGHPALWTAERFLAFYAERPHGERWQLIDGVPVMMVPPTLVHQRIAGNLERLLNDAFETARPDLFAYREVSLRIPGVEDFNPQPDVAVLSAEASYAYYAERFFLVAEVLSPSNTGALVARKVALYRSHPDALAVLVIDQEAVWADLHLRGAEGWETRELRRAADPIAVPALGFRSTLGDLYRGTPLAG